MKRSTFFWLERWKISQKERNTVLIMLPLILLAIFANAMIPEGWFSSSPEYETIAAEFAQRSEAMRLANEENLQKFDPDAPVNTSEAGEALADAASTTTSKKNQKPAEIGIININLAGAEELMKLPGIGKVYAERIIEYRQTKGEFMSVEELIEIKGIGKSRLESLKPYITIQP